MHGIIVDTSHFAAPAAPTPTLAIPRRAASWVTWDGDEDGGGGVDDVDDDDGDDDDDVDDGGALELEVDRPFTLPIEPTSPTSPSSPAPLLSAAAVTSHVTRRVAGLLGTHARGDERGGSRHRVVELTGTSAAIGGERGSKSNVEALADVHRHVEIATLILNGLKTPQSLSRHFHDIGRPLSALQIKRICNSQGFVEIFTSMLDRQRERVAQDAADETANPYRRMHAAEVRAMTLLVEGIEELRARVHGGTTRVMIEEVDKVTGAPTGRGLVPAMPTRAPTPHELNVAIRTATQVLKMGPNANRYTRVTDETQLVAFTPTIEQARVLLEADDEAFKGGGGGGDGDNSGDDSGRGGRSRSHAGLPRSGVGGGSPRESRDMIALMRRGGGGGVDVDGDASADDERVAAASLDAAVDRYKAGVQPRVVDMDRATP